MKVNEHKASKKASSVFVRTAISAAVLMSCGAAHAAVGPISLIGNYIEIGTNSLGTVGSGGGTSPGILFDSTGTGTFNTAHDYLTPGIPFEGFSVEATYAGSAYQATNNNTGTSQVTANSFVNSSSGSYKGVTWTGSYSTGSTKLYDVTNKVGFNLTDKKVTLTSTITAAQNLTNLYFARFTDPDTRAASGDSANTNNFKGNGSVPATNLVYAEALVSKYVLGLYSKAGSGVNTGISSAWTTDPKFFYAGTNNGNGDNTIGMAYYKTSLAAGESVTYTYYYIFGSDIADAIISSGSSSVLGSTIAVRNFSATGAATVIDAHSNLAGLFSSVSGDKAVSDAASQTLPLFTGASLLATNSALYGINRVIQARTEANLGLSSGDAFEGDKNVWMKPFGSWADQNDRNGVAGYKANTYGLVFGLDGTLTRELRIGGAFAYARSDINGHSSIAPQNADIDIYKLIGYGSYSLDNNTDINFQIDAGQNSNKARRQIAFTSSVAAAKYDGQTAHVGLGIGRTFPLSSQTSLTPSVRVDYSWIKDNSYTETGADLLNLKVGSRTTEALVLGADGKLAHQLNDQTTLTANLGIGYDTINKQAAITAAFAGAPDAAFVTYGIDPSPWLARAGVGAVYKTKSGLEITARYDAEYRESFLNQTASVKMRWSF